MSQPNTVQSLNALFKEVYSEDGVLNLVPESNKVLTRIPFSKRDRLGRVFVQPVILGHENGVTYAASDEDAFDLKATRRGAIESAEIAGSQMVLRSQLGVASASRAVSGGKTSFESATKFLVANMLRSLSKRAEIALIYGGVGIGTVASATGNDVVITAAEWAPGIWGGSEGAQIDIYVGNTLVGRSNLTTPPSVTAVDFTTKTVTIDVDLSATLAAGDTIYFHGARAKEMKGLHAILTDSSTDLFGISTQQYSLWKGNTYSASSQALSFTKLQEAIAKAVEKGLDSDVMVLVNPKSWADLLNDQAALRQYDSSYSPETAVNGAKELRFHGQNGMVEIIPSIHVKEGYAYVIDEKSFARIGSTEITFKRPGLEGEFFLERPEQMAYEMRAYLDFALFTHSPGRSVLITGIVAHA